MNYFAGDPRPYLIYKDPKCASKQVACQCYYTNQNGIKYKCCYHTRIDILKTNLQNNKLHVCQLVPA